jgi:hypothetical protein
MPVDATKIHQGPGNLWLRVLRPSASKRLLIDQYGAPLLVRWVTGTYAVGDQIVDAAVNGGIQEVTADADAGATGVTEPSPWGLTLGAETADGDLTWTCVSLSSNIYGGAIDGQSTVNLAAKIELVEADQISAPIDAIMTGEEESLECTMKESNLDKLKHYLQHGTFSTGSGYEELKFGGIIPVPQFSVAVISPHRDSTIKYTVAQLYRAAQMEAVKLPHTRKKETMYGVKFTGLAVTTRAVGDQVGRIYRQT